MKNIFNRFKRSENNETATQEVAVLVSNKYPSVVEQIHHEFESAADNLLLEAKNIINLSSNLNLDKLSRLKNLGFNLTKEVVELEPKLIQKKLSEEQVQLLDYYKKEYPLQKFITEEQVKTICHKYNLVCGDVSRFKGFVPEKNLKQIENFKLKETEENTCIVEAFDEKISLGEFSASNVCLRKSGEYIRICKIGQESKYSFQQSNLSEFKKGYLYGTDYANNFGLLEKGHIQVRIKNKYLQICAPVKDMDISGLELTEGYKLREKHIPDPVVLQPVKGGYLILAAWGDEASDPIVVNEKMN